MPTKKPAPKSEPQTPEAVESAPTNEPINPAIDPHRTAEDRLDALAQQHAEMQRRRDLGLPPD